jgi:hypothetical protein
MVAGFVRLGFAAALAGIEFTIFSAVDARAGTTGGIQGYVNDAKGPPIAGVLVSAVSTADHAQTTTIATGFYALNGLPLDTYAVTFSKDGYIGQTISGVTTVQDQSIRVNAQLQAAKMLARIVARSSSSLVQPTVTADTYVISQTRLSEVNGTPQDLNGNQALESLPGVIAGAGLSPTQPFPTIRAGATQDVGYQYDGVNVANPAVGIFDAFVSPPLNGVGSIQLSTGGYDVSEGNTNSGVINEVIKRGAYPGAGQATIRITSPIYGHELSFDYGGATPNNRFSYFFAFGGLRDAVAYGDQHTLLPLLLGNFTFQTVNDDVLNIFYRFGHDNRDEVQFLSNSTAGTVTFNYLADPAIAPYASNNGNVQASSDPFGLRDFSTFQSSYMTLFPGQVAYVQNTGAADTFTLNSVINKVNFKRQLTPSSFFDLRLFRVSANHVASHPYDTGSFTDFSFDLTTTALGEAFDYSSQVSAQNELSFGAEGVYNRITLSSPNPSLEPFFEPLEGLGCPQAANALGKAPVGGCYIAPFNAALNTRLGLGLPTDPAHAPMSTYADDNTGLNDPTYRWDAWIRDRFTPNARLTIDLGLRWDKEKIPLPQNAAELNTTYYINDSGEVVTVPGQPIGADVTQPSQISPRLALSYQVDAHDAIRFSYGKNIEFVPTVEIESVYTVPASLKNCNIANTCLLPLPGYGATNHVTNLYQQILLDLNTKALQQYTPVLPQSAVNVDFSYEHDFGHGLELRVTPYYRKGTNYVVGTRELLFTLASGTPVYGPQKSINAGINQNTGVELALQRSAQTGLSGLLSATYDNTLANYDGDFNPTVNSAALAAGHFFHITYVAPLTATLNLAYDTPTGWHASTTISYESGYRYGVGKKTFVFDPSGRPVQVLNTDLAVTPSQAYYFTDPTNQGTMFAPNIAASRGTPEGDDPGTLFTPATALVNLTLSHDLGNGPNNFQVGVRAANIFGNYTPTAIPPNLYYVPQGFGGYGPGSGYNTNQCAPGQTFACEPYQYNYSVHPYESEPSGPPRVYTFFISSKY